MDQIMSDVSDHQRRRQPLRDVSSRMNNPKSPKVETPRLRIQESEQLKSPDRMSFLMTPTPQRNKENEFLSVANDLQPDSARNSIMSAASLLSLKGKRKTHVGPWQLGRTLGKGATGRVRLAKHAVTGHTAAIKIVSKKSASMVQSESIAAMDRNIGNFPANPATRQMPCGIEREVVIMKLIEHPNVISLYDVWENRGELYLVLEHVEGGELFDYVSHNGPLPEEEAVRLFRQIIAALGYCHRFNICHRDLKPENILLDANHNVKLADFGMAALQPAGHWLNTSCGSPHYAAPEIIYGRKYRGDRADMWSCGIILYALLTGYLPFDGGDLGSTLRLVKKGDYMIPSELSHEAADLIQRILQKRPEDRISMQNIWLHPLLTKYEKLHNAMVDHYVGPPPALSVKDCGQTLSCQQDIDLDILRNLQTLWHNVKADDLIQRLLCIEPTHERMFYNALAKFRDEQLENYQGQPLEYSASDYHHISRPGGRVRRGRSQTGQGSSKRRTQISSVKDFPRPLSYLQEPMSSGTTASYDPYRSPVHSGTTSEAQYTHVIVHRQSTEQSQAILSSPRVKPPPPIAEEQEPEESGGPDESPFTVLQKRKHGPSSMKSFVSSKVPHSSSRAPGLSTHSMSYRRNVSFHHARNRSHGSTTAKPKKRKIAPSNQQNDVRRSPSTCSLQIMTDAVDLLDMPSSPPLPAQPTVVRANGPKVKSLGQVRKVRDTDYTWREDTRNVSHELSQICEEAFNGSSVTTIRTTSCGSGYETPGTPVSMASPEQVKRSSTIPVSHSSQESSRSYNIKELVETRQKLIEHSRGRKDNVPAYLSGVISHLDRLIKEDQAHNGTGLQLDAACCQDPFLSSPKEAMLPVINENCASTLRDPSEACLRSQQKPGTYLASSQGDAKATIRMVPHSSLPSMEEVKPLTIRKKNYSKFASSDVHEFAMGDPTGGSLNSSIGSRHAAQSSGLAPIEEIPLSPKKSTARAPEGKKWSWFKNRSQGSDNSSALPLKDGHLITPSGGTTVHHPITFQPTSSSKEEPVERVPRRKTSMDRFGGGFFKKLLTKKTTQNMEESPSHNERDLQSTPTKDNRHSSLICKGLADTDSSVEADDTQNPPHHKRRSIANHNWLARVFQIKPATQVIALNTSKVKGRKELYKLLREWRDFGMEDVYLDKTNSIVHGRVSEANFLHLREVEFTAEFYTVLEHGLQANLSLVRFKQERGAASSFNKVVETVQSTLMRRGMVVEDPSRAKKMARVLDSVPNYR
ncbi:Serine/threonine protein kinase (Kcc4), putative [Penicillium digitatum]|uniref:non-specific serine/threonine protein kinase n=2 Tax=Penicillium digitatum TaxID=36651 RepID=K9FLE1_PEND1|nr:Serine/threonine protein kinase (Kcc4), putative [Penicillium digitatum Pd1]EKV10059.1 Serine/threonine protein kinase (Kcc4), putative [Penicillium digitatum Pd1]QQK44380.1 Serine/threonine protein kinase (Kcc4), putative [Penicillium digitatum]